MPILLLIGDREIMYEPQKALTRATQIISNLKAELIPNAGHMLNSDQPDGVNAYVLKFLAGDWPR